MNVHVYCMFIMYYEAYTCTAREYSSSKSNAQDRETSPAINREKSIKAWLGLLESSMNVVLQSCNEAHVLLRGALLLEQVVVGANDHHTGRAHPRKTMGVNKGQPVVKFSGRVEKY